MVDGDELLALGRAADDDAALGQAPVVEGVERLAALHHHVVRHVDEVVDGPHADRFEPRGQPRGARPHPDAADDPGGVERAEVGLGHLDPREGADGVREFVERDIGQAERKAEGGSNLAGDADVAEAVGPVARDLHQEARVAAAEVGDAVDVEADARQDVGQVPWREVGLHVLGQPSATDVHGSRSLRRDRRRQGSDYRRGPGGVKV